MFTNVNLVLPIMGISLCVVSLLMDLIYSLKSEKRDFDKALQNNKEAIMFSVKAVDDRVRSVEAELARMNRSGVF